MKIILANYFHNAAIKIKINKLIFLNAKNMKCNCNAHAVILYDVP